MADGTKDSMGRDLQAVALKIQEQENDPLVMNTKIRLKGGGGEDITTIFLFLVVLYPLFFR